MKFSIVTSYYNRKKQLLSDQIIELKSINYDINIVYMKNEELNLNDNTKK